MIKGVLSASLGSGAEWSVGRMLALEEAGGLEMGMSLSEEREE